MKKILAPMIVLGISLFVAVLVAEVALRVTGLAPADTGVFTVTQRQFEEIPGIWGPGQDQEVLKNPNLPFRVTTNALGYRGEDFPLEKPDGEFRVFYVGDSFTFGDFVDDHETMPAMLETSAAVWLICGAAPGQFSLAALRNTIR